MTNFGSLLQFPEELQTTANGSEHWKPEQGQGGQLLELRSETERIYVRLSRWQRYRFQWTFRHFHVLPPQVLSRGDQDLIEELARTAVVIPDAPVPADAVVGVVEKIRLKPRGGAHRVVTLRVRPDPDFLPNSVSAGPRGQAATRIVWRDWGALAAVCLAVVLLSVHRSDPAGHQNTAQSPAPALAVEHGMSEHPALGDTAVSKAAVPKPLEMRRIAVSVAESEPLPRSRRNTQGTSVIPAVVRAEEPASRASAPPPALALIRPQPAAPVFHDPASAPAGASEETAVNPAAAAHPIFVAELPQSHFVHPQGNLQGELRLRALIGTDGSVKQVTVLSGDPRLAQVAMRAVRQWRYSPYEVLGSPVEVETQIKMNFFGQDAVSIASVTQGLPGAQQ